MAYLGRPQIVLFGSSIVQFSYGREGWGAILADLYCRKADILLRGYAGWNSRRAVQVLDKVFPKGAIVQPSLVIVYFGGNDSVPAHPSGLGPHVPLDEYVENMRKIALHLKSLSEKTRIIFLTTPPVNETKAREIYGNRRTNEVGRIYSNACIELCRELNVKVVDMWSALQQGKDWASAYFWDGIHLTSEGSKIVAREILKTIQEANWEPSLYYKRMPNEFSEESPYDPIAPGGNNTMNVSDIEPSWQVQWSRF